jgi:hypothetical protein
MSMTLLPLNISLQKIVMLCEMCLQRHEEFLENPNAFAVHLRVGLRLWY